MSDTLVRMMNHQDYDVTQGTRVLYVFDGVPPTKEDVLEIKALDTSDGEVRLENLCSWADGRSNNMLQANVYDGLGSDRLRPSYPNNKLVQWPLSERVEEFRDILDGTPTWFAFCVTGSSISIDPSTTNPTTIQTLSGKSLVTYFGNAGDEESEADLAILSGFVDSNKEYSTTDLEIFFI
jgi:hypothetical protein